MSEQVNSMTDQLIVLQFVNCESLINLWPRDFTPAAVFWSNTYQKSLVNSMIKTFYSYFNISENDIDALNKFIVEYNGNFKITYDNLKMLFNNLIKTVLKQANFNCTIKEIDVDNIHKYKLIAYTTMLK